VSAGYIVRRLIYALLNLWLVISVSFFLFRLMPGDPVAAQVGELGDIAVKERLTEQLGLNEPMIVQYGTYIGNLVQGDFGFSLNSRTPVWNIVSRGFVNTGLLALVTFTIAYVSGSIVGSLLAWKRGSAIERFGLSLGLFLRGVPTFWAGMMLVFIFSVNLNWLPASGMRTGNFGNSSWTFYLSGDFLEHLVLPALAGAITLFGLPLLLMRNMMVDALESGYIDLARAKGLSELRVVFGHAFRNALLPLIAASTTILGWLIGGLVAVEVVFSWPGLGREIVNAVQDRDYTVAQGALVLVGCLVVFMYFFGDLLATYVDPRARFGKARMLES
jgi:peptide/nickel transport system permease protein